MNSGDKSAMQSWLAKVGLPAPYVPAALAAKLSAIADSVFSTRDLETLPASPYELAPYVAEAEAAETADYALIGHDGHGINSYALHYYLVHGRLGIFFQLPWGGGYTNPQEAAATIAQVFAEYEPLIRAACEQPPSKGERLLVVLSGFYGSRFRLPRAPWQKGRSSLSALITALG